VVGVPRGYARVAVTTQNAEFVRRFFEDVNKRDVDALLARLTPELEMTLPAGMGVEPRTYRGPEGFRRWFDGFSEIMEIRVESLRFHRGRRSSCRPPR
jgi:ketosteroid isomerase-like protein